MTTEISQDSQNTLICRGKIKTYDDFLDFKDSVEEAKKMLEKASALVIFFINAYPINSYAIGYLLKLKENDGMDVNVWTNDSKIIQLFEYLELDEKFHLTLKPTE